MTTPPHTPDLSENHAEPARDPEFPAKRHSVPLAIGFPQVIGFSACKIAPGLEIREATQADADRLTELNKTYASMLTMMQTAPLARTSYVLCIDEQLYGHHVEQKIRATGKSTDPRFKRFQIEHMYKMIVTALHLFHLVQLSETRYFITHEYDKDFFHLEFFTLLPIQVTWGSWDKYAFQTYGYNLTSNGTIMCDEVIRAVNVLEKYYQHNYWMGNRIAVALHNFWNALFVPESTLAFVALMSVIETFTNLSKSKKETVEAQVYRNTLKLVHVDGNGNVVTKKRLEEMYNVRSFLSHGSYGWDGRTQPGWLSTGINAKFSNVDIRLSTDLMSITAKLLHRVIFDPSIVSILEGAETSAQERRRLREHLDVMPSVETSGPPQSSPNRLFAIRRLARDRNQYGRLSFDPSRSAELNGVVSP